jgi:hypothetical protein
LTLPELRGNHGAPINRLVRPDIMSGAYNDGFGELSAIHFTRDRELPFSGMRFGIAMADWPDAAYRDAVAALSAGDPALSLTWCYRRATGRGYWGRTMDAPRDTRARWKPPHPFVRPLACAAAVLVEYRGQVALEIVTAEDAPRSLLARIRLRCDALPAPRVIHAGEQPDAAHDGVTQPLDDGSTQAVRVYRGTARSWTFETPTELRQIAIWPPPPTPDSLARDADSPPDNFSGPWRIGLLDGSGDIRGAARVTWIASFDEDGQRTDAPSRGADPVIVATPPGVWTGYIIEATGITDVYVAEIETAAVAPALD